MIINVGGTRVEATKLSVMGADGQEYTRFAFEGGQDTITELRSACALRGLKPTGVTQLESGACEFTFEFNTAALSLLADIQKGLGSAIGRAA